MIEDEKATRFFVSGGFAGKLAGVICSGLDAIFALTRVLSSFRLASDPRRLDAERAVPRDRAAGGSGPGGGPLEPAEVHPGSLPRRTELVIFVSGGWGGV